jgi:hypothetical protein
MAGVTVGSGTSGTTLNAPTSEALAVAQALAAQITGGLASGGYTSLTYDSSSMSAVAPVPAAGLGVVTFSAPTQYTASGQAVSVYVGATDQVIIDEANGPTSIQGGAAGGVFLGGAGLAGAARNVTYTNITPSGTLTDDIAILGGNNLIQTATTGTGNYDVNTGSGNDTVNILAGDATINAGTGYNQINLGPGNSLIYSEGFDTITGSSVGGGSDTVEIGSGQTSINSGTSSFLVDDRSPNGLLVTLGFGVDTINFDAGNGGGTVRGISSAAQFTGVGTLTGTDASTGDGITVSGAGSATISAAGAAETISGAGSSGSNLFNAGSGNDTLIAGAGPTTLAGGTGTTLMQSGTGADTFLFSSGGHSLDAISGFKASDVLQFDGFGITSVATKAAGGGTIISLPDGTQVTLLGVASLNPNQVILK